MGTPIKHRLPNLQLNPHPVHLSDSSDSSLLTIPLIENVSMHPSRNLQLDYKSIECFLSFSILSSE